MKVSTITSSQYEAAKKKAISTAPVRKIVNTGDIRIENDFITIGGQKMQFSTNGIMDLANLMGIPSSFSIKYSNIFGDEHRDQLINHIARGLGSMNIQVMLVASPVSKKIIAVQPAGYKYLSNISSIKLIEDTLNQYPQLSISRMYVSENGELRVNMLNNDDSLNFGKGEDFYAGLDLTNSPYSGTSMSNYMFRQVCTNGMITSHDIKMISGFDDDVVRNLYLGVKAAANMQFIPTGFGDRIKRAQETPASLHELKGAVSFMPKETIHRDKFINFSEIMSDLRGRRIDPAKLNTQQMKNCKIKSSVYDVVNAITDYASHDYGFKINDMQGGVMQRYASNLFFKKNYDTKNLI